MVRAGSRPYRQGKGCEGVCERIIKSRNEEMRVGWQGIAEWSTGEGREISSSVTGIGTGTGRGHSALSGRQCLYLLPLPLSH